MTLKLKDMLVIAAIVIVASLVSAVAYDKFGKTMFVPKDIKKV